MTERERERQQDRVGETVALLFIEKLTHVLTPLLM